MQKLSVFSSSSASSSPCSCKITLRSVSSSSPSSSSTLKVLNLDTKASSGVSVKYHGHFLHFVCLIYAAASFVFFFSFDLSCLDPCDGKHERDRGISFF